MQNRVRQRFSELQAQDKDGGQVTWHVVNAAQSIEEVQKEINEIVENTIDRIEGQILPRLWPSVIKGKETN